MLSESALEAAFNKVEKLMRELINENRFFPQKDLLDEISTITKQSQHMIKSGQKFYRARKYPKGMLAIINKLNNPEET